VLSDDMIHLLIVQLERSYCFVLRYIYAIYAWVVIAARVIQTAP